MIYKVSLVALLAAVTISNAQAMDPLTDDCLSLVVYRLPIDGARNFSECSKRTNKVVWSNKAWCTFKRQFIRSEPTISLMQALEARRYYKDSHLLDLLRRDARQKARLAGKMREQKNTEALEYRVANRKDKSARLLLERAEKPYNQETYEAIKSQEDNNEVRYLLLEREAEKFEQDIVDLESESQKFLAQSQQALRVACELGDCVAISRTVKHLNKAPQPAPYKTTLAFLEPLVERGYVKPSQLKRDTLWKSDLKEKAKALNAQLIEEGHVEALHFAKARFPREPQKKSIVFKDLNTIKTRLATCGSEEKFKEILKGLRFHPKSRAFVKEQHAEFEKWLADYRLKSAGDSRYSSYPHVLAYALVQKEAFEAWLKEYEACFPEFCVSVQQTDEDSQLVSRFKTLIDEGNLAEAFALFDDLRQSFTQPVQFASLLAIVPYDAEGDSLRERVVESLRKCILEQNQVEGIYHFLLRGKDRFSAEEYANLSKVEKRSLEINALKFAKLMDYFPPRRK